MSRGPKDRQQKDQMSSDAEKVGGHTNNDSQVEHVLGLALEEVGDRKSPAAGFPSLGHVAIDQPRLPSVFLQLLYMGLTWLYRITTLSCYDLNSRGYCRYSLISFRTNLGSPGTIRLHLQALPRAPPPCSGFHHHDLQIH